eukprot:56194-Chlamydomonas_euryale.AAC.4
MPAIGTSPPPSMPGWRRPDDVASRHDAGEPAPPVADSQPGCGGDTGTTDGCGATAAAPATAGDKAAAADGSAAFAACGVGCLLLPPLCRTRWNEAAVESVLLMGVDPAVPAAGP